MGNAGSISSTVMKADGAMKAEIEAMKQRISCLEPQVEAMKQRISCLEPQVRMQGRILFDMAARFGHGLQSSGRRGEGKGQGASTKVGQARM